MTTYTLLCSNSRRAGNPVTAEIIYASFFVLDIPGGCDRSHPIITGDGHQGPDHMESLPKQESTAAGSPYEPAETYRITGTRINSGAAVEKPTRASGTEFTG